MNRILVSVAVGGFVAMTGCAEGATASTVVVSAASSLTDAFGQMEDEFEAANPDIDVVVNLASSATLREQILDGAPVDVFASANESTMAELVTAGRAAGTPVVFARNRLQIAVPRGNPGRVTGLSDFARDGLLIGLCAEGVPCGDLARKALQAAAIEPSIDTNEANVRALLTKLEAGEIDAGIVYVSDLVAAGGEVEAIDFGEASGYIADYPIVVVEGGPNPEGAAAFVNFVVSEEGQRILANNGFLP